MTSAYRRGVWKWAENKEGQCTVLSIMSNSVLVHTQGISGFDHQRWDWNGETATAYITRRPDRFRCAGCGSADVTATPVGERTVRGVPLGVKPFDAVVRMHRLKCHECGAYRMEQLEFLPSSHAHITRALQRTVVELRREMSISAISQHFGLDWKTVKDADKRHLQRKYRTVRLRDVTTIGIDEIYVGHKKFKTVVRDLEQGSVLHVGDGKGRDALKGFWRRLSPSKATIRAVAMDMSSGYARWVREKLPEAEIVFDHFHLIKLMNERVDKVRRRTIAELEEDERKALKKNASCC